jgi:carbonic anhydrase/acetyltransferase-like protein (isoleucine patch superfamily)
MFTLPQANIISFRGQKPRLAPNVFVASGAQLIGDLEIGEDSSVWFNVTIRADVQRIRIGARTNIQDNTVIHVTHGTGPTTIGSDVTIGHGAVIHACTVEDLCLIGMGAILLDGAVIPRESFVAAGALVTPGKTFPPGSMIMGSPAKAVRSLTAEEKAGLKKSALHYVETTKAYTTSAD